MTRKWTQVNASFRLAFNLRFLWPPTCVDLRWHWSSSNSYPGRRKFFTVWPPNAFMCEIYDFAICVNLQADLRIRLTTHSKFWFCKLASRLASTCESVWPGHTEEISLFYRLFYEYLSVFSCELRSSWLLPSTQSFMALGIVSPAFQCL